MKAQLTLLAFALIGSAGCQLEAPERSQLFNRFSTVTAGSDEMLSALGSREGGGEFNDAQLETQVIAVASSAERRLEVAFEHLESTAVAQSLVDAQERGVDVRVVGDIDHRNQAGFRLLTDPMVGLRDNGDGIEPVTFGDGEIFYSPQPTVEVLRAGDLNRMTHNFIIADESRVVNLTGGFFSPEAGQTFQIGFDVTSEDIAKDFGDELVQMYGGMFSTTLSTFNGPLKSDTNTRTHYPTDLGDLEIYFGPQERLTKRLIDEIYKARASVFIATESLNNNFIRDALRYKAESGFDVGVVVSTENRDSAFSRVDELRELFDDMRGGDILPDLRLAEGVKLNMVIIDANPSPINGKTYKTKVFVLSQPLLESISFTTSATGTEARASDSFSDANMWVLTRTSINPEPNVDRFIKVFEFLFNKGQ
jgi:hypothetical protein